MRFLTSRISPKYVLTLATLSGVCGISYELLYSRMLSSYFGDVFYISAAILVGFLGSIALGSLFASRFTRFLPYVEMGIGAYGLLAVYVFNVHAFSLVRFVADFGGLETAVALTLSVLLLLFIPAVLIGFSVPMFALYVRSHMTSSDVSEGFRWTYLLYNVGAALSVLAVEFMLVHIYGITVSVLSVALLNFVIGIALLFVATPSYVYPDTRSLSHKRTLVALLLASMASGVFQLLYLKVSHRIFGPLNENFAIVLATAFVGIAFGSFLVGRYQLRNDLLLFVSAIVVLVTFILTTPVIYAWAFAQSGFALALGVSSLVKVGVLFVWGIASFTCFGALVPAFLKHIQDSDVRTSGRFLAVSAIGNALGFLLMVFVLHQFLPLPLVAVTSALLLVGAGIVLRFKSWTVPRIPSVVASVLLIGATTGLLFAWPGIVLHLGYDNLSNPQSIAFAKERVAYVEEFKHGGDSASVLHTKNSEKMLTHNGYFSLFTAEGSPVVLREVIAGTTGALFSKAHDSALVLGLGTGITAGAVSELYRHTRVVEVNPAMRSVAQTFRGDNFALLDKEQVVVSIQDGFLALEKETDTYDLIVNTVSSPVYYSAGKLWTQEAVALIRDRLNEGGVFSTWFDLRVGNSGIATQLATFSTVFPECAYFLLNIRYVNVVCGTVLHTADVGKVSTPLLRDAYAKMGVSEPSMTFFDALRFTLPPAWEALLQPGTPPQLHTLDNPILEFSGGAYRYLDVHTKRFFDAIREQKRQDIGNSQERCAHISAVLNKSNTIYMFPECALEAFAI